jgi:hypothetical protein
MLQRVIVPSSSVTSSQRLLGTSGTIHPTTQCNAAERTTNIVQIKTGFTVLEWLKMNHEL